MKTSCRATRALFPLFTALVLLSAAALPAAAAPEEDTAMSTGVARLKIAKGTAWVRPADSLEWEEYSHNSPVVERARVSIPVDSEAEIQFRGSQFLLLEGGSEADVRQLGEQKASFRLRAGRAAFSLSKENFAPVTVKLPGNRDASLNAPGLYWLTIVGEAAKLDVRRGEGTVSGEGLSPVAVKGGEEASIGKEVRVGKAAVRAGSAGSGPAPEPVLTEAEREAGIPSSAAAELRGHGEWVWTSEYGYVWRPNVSNDWAPYYYGRWAWVYPYGWNWIGYEPWGWWPYHYGWWVSAGVWGWVWAPYNSHYYGGYPYYRPANVRFENDGRTVRWIPEQPGREGTRQNAPRNTFSRTDTRLSQWNQPMPGGAGPATARPLPEGGGRVTAVPGGSGTSGRSAGGGRSPYYSVAPGGQGRHSANPQGAGYVGGAGSRGSGSGFAPYPSIRGNDTGYRGSGGGASGGWGGGGGRGGAFGGGGGGRAR